MLYSRLVNKFYANMNGYFWLPCPICGKKFGGHEWLVDEQWSNIPDPEHPADPGRGVGICPDCTRAGVGKEAWNAKEWSRE